MITETQVQALGEFARLEFTLEQEGDHIVFLLHQGQQVELFTQTGAAPESLQKACADHLVTKHGWSGCLWRKE